MTLVLIVAGVVGVNVALVLFLLGLLFVETRRVARHRADAAHWFGYASMLARQKQTEVNTR